jgi:hypothetical protein
MFEQQMAAAACRSSSRSSAAPTPPRPASPAPAARSNPWDDDFGGSLDARFQSLEQKMEGWLQQLAQPLMADQQAKAVAEGEQRLQDVLADDIGRHGEFSSKPEVDREARHLVRTLADHIYDGLAGRFGGHDQSSAPASARACPRPR